LFERFLGKAPESLLQEKKLSHAATVGNDSLMLPMRLLSAEVSFAMGKYERLVEKSSS
jgi:hypothetical protein